MDPGQVRQ